MFTSGRGFWLGVYGAVFSAACSVASLPVGAMDPPEEEELASPETTPGRVIWSRQFGTDDASDWVDGVAIDPAGNVLIVGMEDETSKGWTGTTFIAKYDRTGTLSWKVSPVFFWGYPFMRIGGAATDAAGNMLIAGEAQYGDGPDDAIVAKYGPSGTLLWTRFLGTSAAPDVTYAANDVATDTHGNVLIAGYTGGYLGGIDEGSDDAFVAKYNPSGKLLWKRQIGSPDRDGAGSVATDAQGNVLIAGETLGSLGGPNKGSGDAFVAKYGPSGNLLWKRQFGSRNRDEARGVAADAHGNVLITGRTDGIDYGQRPYDAFVAKFSPSGNLLWKQRFGSPQNNDSANRVATDAAGNVLIVGLTWDGGFVVKYSCSGTLLWKRLFASSDLRDVATDIRGNVFIAGSREADAFVAKLRP